MGRARTQGQSSPELDGTRVDLITEITTSVEQYVGLLRTRTLVKVTQSAMPTS
jgi:hypothetical protein